MSKTLKTLLTIVVIVMGAMWLLTVYRSCKNNNTQKTGITASGSDISNSDATAGSDKLEDLYEDEDEDGTGDGESSEAGTATDATGSGADGASGADGDGSGGEDAEEEGGDASEYEADDNVSVSGSGIDRNGGEFLVVAGAFISKSNAKKYQKQLARKGYDSEIRVFIGSDYHSVIIGEYESRGEAIRTADKIGGEAYAHKKRYPKKRRR